MTACSTLEFAHKETQRLQYAYVTNARSDTVSAYSIDASSGAMAPVPGSPFAAGNNPNTVAVNPAGTFAYVANGGASVLNGPGTVSAYRVDAATGALTPVPGSPFAAGRYPSSIAVNPAGTFVYVTNGDDNTISAYRIHASTGALTPIPGSPFAGTLSISFSPFVGAPVAKYAPEPSCITINPAGTFAYVANFGGDSVSAYRITPATGALTMLPDSPFAAKVHPETVAINPAGTFAYVVGVDGRGAILAYRMNALTGTLTPVLGHAAYVNTSPSSITVNPTGTFAYVTSSGAGSGMPPNLNVIRIDASTGALDDLGAFGYQTGHDATFVAVNPAGTFVYVANEGLRDVSGRWNGGGISVYHVNATYGTLDEIRGSPFATGAYPSSIAMATSSRAKLRIHHGEPRRPLRRFGGHRG